MTSQLERNDADADHHRPCVGGDMTSQLERNDSDADHHRPLRRWGDDLAARRRLNERDFSDESAYLASHFFTDTRSGGGRPLGCALAD